MKLTSRSNLVKPDRLVLQVAAVTAAAVLLTIHLVLVLTDDQQARMDRFGAAAARALAELAVEPLMRQDRLHLGVIGNRLAETPEVSAVATYSSDEVVLTATGALSEPLYTQPVTLDDTIVGYVRLALNPPAFAEPVTERSVGLLVAALLLPLLVASAWTLTRAVLAGELAHLRPAMRRAAVGRAAAAARTTDEPAPVPQEEPTPPAEICHYLLAVNLYNQLALGASEREFERSLASELAEAVAEIHDGQVVSLPGIGVLVDFDHSEDEDRAFQVLCGALLLARLLADEAPFGRYRLGLNLVRRGADQAVALDDPAIADAALLSALAPEGTLAVSAPVAEALAGEHRYLARTLVNPLLDELTTSSPGCYLITGLAAPFDTRIVQQAEQLKSQRDAVSSPSTF